MLPGPRRGFRLGRGAGGGSSSPSLSFATPPPVCTPADAIDGYLVPAQKTSCCLTIRICLLYASSVSRRLSMFARGTETASSVRNGWAEFFLLRDALKLTCVCPCRIGSTALRWLQRNVNWAMNWAETRPKSCWLRYFGFGKAANGFAAVVLVVHKATHYLM